MFQPPGFFAQLFDGCRKAKPRQNRRAQRQSAHWRRNGETSPTGSNGRAALRSSPVEIEAHGPERNERRQERAGSAPHSVALEKDRSSWVLTEVQHPPPI